MNRDGATGMATIAMAIALFSLTGQSQTKESQPGARERKISWGAKQQAPKARDRDAEGVEGGEVWGGVHPPHPTRGLGSIVSYPSGVRAVPRRKTNLVHSDALRRPLVTKIHKVW